MKEGSNRKDLLSYLMAARDESGKPMPEPELKAEALTQLIAGSDTTSNSLASIIDLLCRHPKVYSRLQKELDDAFPDGLSADEIAKFTQVQDLPYLNAVINESMRYRPTSAMGLPRVVPEGGAEVSGRCFKEGTVLSVPSYSIHHNPIAFDDPDSYWPERWLEGDQNALKKYFIPFSYGPRACVGRNVLLPLELSLY